MTADDTASLIYLALLGAAIAGYAIVANRGQLGQMLRQVFLWALIFLGVIAGYGVWQDVQGDLVPKQAVFSDDARVEVPRSADGHYYLTVNLNGKPINFVVDTGATNVVLTKDDAARIGIDLDRLVYSAIAQTANGETRSARARVDEVVLGDIVDRNVVVWVNEGEMFGSLLGMDYLQRFDRISIEGNQLVLER